MRTLGPAIPRIPFFFYRGGDLDHGQILFFSLGMCFWLNYSFSPPSNEKVVKTSSYVKTSSIRAYFFTRVRILAKSQGYVLNNNFWRSFVCKLFIRIDIATNWSKSWTSQVAMLKQLTQAQIDFPSFCLMVWRQSNRFCYHLLLTKWLVNDHLNYLKEWTIPGFKFEYQYLVTPFKVDRKSRQRIGLEAPLRSIVSLKLSKWLMGSVVQP